MSTSRARILVMVPFSLTDDQLQAVMTATPSPVMRRPSYPVEARGLATAHLQNGVRVLNRTPDQKILVRSSPELIVGQWGGWIALFPGPAIIVPIHWFALVQALA